MEQLSNVRNVYAAARDAVPAPSPANVFNVGDTVTVGFDNEWSSIEVKIEAVRGTILEGSVVTSTDEYMRGDRVTFLG